jgi:hypothetical protein
MSYPGLYDSVMKDIVNIEVSATHGHANTSPIRDGASTPGGAANLAKPAHETQMVGRLRAGIRTPRTRTDKLTRRYGA